MMLAVFQFLKKLIMFLKLRKKEKNDWVIIWKFTRKKR